MALFKTTAELVNYFPTRLTFQLEDLLPALNQAEEEYLAELVMGRAQYEELHAAYQAGMMDLDQTALLEKARPVSAHMAIFNFTGIANVGFSSGGLVVNTSEKQAPASEWRTRDLERSVLRMGHRALDELIDFMIRNAVGYPTWMADPAYTRLGGLLPRTRTFNRYVDIGNSGYLFLRMNPTRERIERERVEPVLCSTTLADTLKDEGRTDAWSSDVHKEIMEVFVRPTVAYLTMADSITELALKKDSRGIWTFASLMGGMTSEGAMAATDKALDALKQHYERNGERFLQALRKRLQELAEAGQLPDYATSDCYQDPNAEKAPDPSDNTERRIVGLY